jgi:predicted Zn-dependent peptidase
VSQAELRGAVSYLAGQAEVSRQNAASVAGEILECWISAGSLEEMSDPGAPFRAVTAEDLQRLAASSLDPGRRAEGVVRGTGAARPPAPAAAAR